MRRPTPERVARSIGALISGLALVVTAVGLLYSAWNHFPWLLPTTPLGYGISALWVIGAAVAAGYLAGRIALRAPVLHAFAAGILISGVEVSLGVMQPSSLSVSISSLLLTLGATTAGGAVVRWHRRQSMQPAA